MMISFFRCPCCQEIIIYLYDNQNRKHCCGKEMEVLSTNFYPEEQEEHTIQVRKIGHFVTVTIGKEEHPMVDIHYIDWVILETDQGIQYKKLKIGEKPVVDFFIDEQEEILNAYAYCTVHSLWSYN